MKKIITTYFIFLLFTFIAVFVLNYSIFLLYFGELLTPKLLFSKVDPMIRGVFGFFNGAIIGTVPVLCTVFIKDITNNSREN